MKQKFIYAVLILACLYVPTSSRECCTVSVAEDMKKAVVLPEQKTKAVTEDISGLPVSPFGSYLLNI